MHLLHVHGLWHDAAGFHLRLISGALMVILLAGLGATLTLCRLWTGSYGAPWWPTPPATWP